MNISKYNYEAFFLDYHEGNLTPQQVAELLLFVEQHPELREEFESFENISLEDFSMISFENKADLKKEITAQNKDEYFIRAVENTLTAAEQDLLTTFLKQHPQFSADLGLFKKTKLSADLSITFEGKNELKRIAQSSVPSPGGEGWDEVLIASVEGLLSTQENAMLNQQLAVNAGMQHALSLYKQTKAVADPAIVYENKEELKRRKNRVVPFYYFVAAAAAILLIFGIFSLFNTPTTTQPEFAKNDKGTTTQPAKEKNPAEQSPAIKENINTPQIQNQSAAVVKNDHIKNTNAGQTNKTTNDSLKINSPAINEPEDKNLAQNPPVNKQEPVTNEQPMIAKSPDAANNGTPAVALLSPAKTEKKENNDEYLSLAQIAAKKIKKKTLDEETYASEKKAGKLKKFSGWDVLQVVAKGVSKVTGKNVEVKPTYNEEGDVTAYAFNAGKLGFSKEK